jgi:very-short-patch-repair endonuclease
MGNTNNTSDDFLTPDPSPKERGGSFEAVKSGPGYLTGNSEVVRELVQHAKINRKESTEAEILLWDNLRNRKLGEKFRRQHPVGGYIPDFVCLEKRVVIEVDGGYHNASEQIELDENRAFELEQKYLFKVIRFTNEEVLKDIETVLSKIRVILSKRKL